jgi:ClpP class serine protease
MSGRRYLPAQRFERSGFLAIEPKAFFELFMVPVEREAARVGNVDVIDISGPLVQRDEMWCDSYESIRKRVRAACESDAQAIVMRFDSPGGDASGCFETARAIRADCARANKPLYAYIDRCCSAAYALASAATEITIGETCSAGSIGVLSTRADHTAANMARGFRMAFVTSGARKLDGNPDVPISEAELAETQKHVDELATKFFALIADQRPQLSAATLAGFDGGVFYGDAAVDAGLADAVATFDDLLACAGRKESMSVMQAKSDYDSARASLEKVAKGNDANAAAAKRALAAMAEAAPADDDEEEKPKEDAADEDDDKPGAESEEDKPGAESDAGEPGAESEDEPPADKKPESKQAAAQSNEMTLAAKVQRLEAQIANDRDARVRRSLLASRPDFSAEVRATLNKASLAQVREAVKTWPKAKVSKKPITTVAATAGETQIDRIVPPSDSTASELDRRMGLTGQKLGCRKEGSTLFFGVVSEDKPTPAGAA